MRACSIPPTAAVHVTRSKWTKGSPVNKDFYKVELTYDRNSNITWAEDKVHTGMDVQYAMDDLNRLTKAEEGTRSGSSIATPTRTQDWTTLTHTGNWGRVKYDLTGDGDFIDTNEYDDTRTHTKANAIATQDIDSNSSVNYTLVHDLAGNLTDDNHNYKYEWDVFGRLRKVKNQSNNLVAEYRYNGLGFRIAWHEDSDTDGDVDGNDKWYFVMYDEAWRPLAVFRESDTAPKEEFIPHLAGLDGFGGSSKLDGVICRYRDANTAWTTASDGTLEERKYLLQNWRGDVSVILDTAASPNEWVKYSAYGIPFALPAGDTDSDGDCDATDTNQIQTWINGSAYDIRGDLDLDGDVDATDKTNAVNNYSGTTLGWNVLTKSSLGNRRGYAGYEKDVNIASQWHVRHRVLDSQLGRWLRRDPSSYSDSPNLLQYVGSASIVAIDPYGLQGQSVGVSPSPQSSNSSAPMCDPSDGTCCEPSWQLIPSFNVTGNGVKMGLNVFSITPGHCRMCGGEQSCIFDVTVIVEIATKNNEVPLTPDGPAYGGWHHKDNEVIPPGRKPTNAGPTWTVNGDAVHFSDPPSQPRFQYTAGGNMGHTIEVRCGHETSIVIKGTSAGKIMPTPSSGQPMIGKIETVTGTAIFKCGHCEDIPGFPFDTKATSNLSLSTNASSVASSTEATIATGFDSTLQLK